MKTKILFCGVLAVAIAALTGCVTKARSFDAKGMYVSESGQLAVGNIHVDAIPEGTDSAVVHYTEDTALLSPSTKTHDIDIILTGTNSVGSAKGIVKAICDAFVKVAPSMPAAGGNSISPLDLAARNRDASAKERLAKTAAKKSAEVAADKAADCADGSCEDPCADGSCDDPDTLPCADGSCDDLDATTSRPVGM